jgi:hypothetical protein
VHGIGAAGLDHDGPRIQEGREKPSQCHGRGRTASKQQRSARKWSAMS